MIQKTDLYTVVSGSALAAQCTYTEKFFDGWAIRCSIRLSRWSTTLLSYPSLEVFLSRTARRAMRDINAKCTELPRVHGETGRELLVSDDSHRKHQKYCNDRLEILI